LFVSLDRFSNAGKIHQLELPISSKAPKVGPGEIEAVESFLDGAGWVKSKDFPPLWSDRRPPSPTPARVESSAVKKATASPARRPSKKSNTLPPGYAIKPLK
jgi:hypothetical protein